MESLGPYSDTASRGREARRHGGFYLLPSLFTAGTLVCGYFAILSTLKATVAVLPEASWQAFDAAAKAIGLAILVDGLDGRIARLANSSSDFGREFDSLADIIAFGMAPAFLAFAWGVRPVEQVIGPLLGQHLRQLGWIITFGFVICGAARLARFNISSARPISDRRYFVGLPIPAAAGVIAAVIHFRKDTLHDWGYGLAWLLVVGLVAFLMVSRVRYPSFKQVDMRRRRPYVYIIIIGVTLYAVWLYSDYVLLALALAYMLSGPTLRLLGRHHPSPPAPHEVHAA